MFERDSSREQRVARLVLGGLALEESDNVPPLPLWPYAGLPDGALVWMNNTSRVEIRDCHLKNSGRHGIRMIRHNTESLVTGCCVEHLGVNGVSFCIRFLAPNNRDPTRDRCEHTSFEDRGLSERTLHRYAVATRAWEFAPDSRRDRRPRLARIAIRSNTSSGARQKRCGQCRVQSGPVPAERF